MRKSTLPAFHRCQQSAIMTSILYDLDSKKQIRYIADLLFHLCNISPSKLYTDLCNSVAAALDQLPVVGDHENGSAAPHLAFQPFRDQAHNSARQDRWLTHQESVSCDRKRRRRRWQAVAFVRRTGWTGAHPCTRKGQILSADVLHGLCFLPSIRYSAAAPPPHSP